MLIDFPSFSLCIRLLETPYLFFSRFIGVNPALVGLVLSYVLSLTSTLSGVVTAYAETEREMVSVERIAEYLESSELSPELSSDTLPNLVVDSTGDSVGPANSVPFGWPHLGWVNFNNVVLRSVGSYRL